VLTNVSLSLVNPMSRGLRVRVKPGGALQAAPTGEGQDRSEQDGAGKDDGGARGYVEVVAEFMPTAPRHQPPGGSGRPNETERPRLPLAGGQPIDHHVARHHGPSRA
jgi:hypothetical protein